MEFEKRKAMAMAAISSTEPDKSPKGTLDAPIILLLDAINLHPSFFTTSSCSGRITILSHNHPVPSSNEVEEENSAGTEKEAKKKKAGGGGWILVTHDPADPESVVDLLFRENHNNNHPSGEQAVGGSLVFRFEPLIIAVDCKDAEAAQWLVSTAISCGFRESGITNLNKRIMVAIRCSIRLEVPLGDIGRIVVSPEYVRYLVEIANEKMEANRRRTDGFFQKFVHQIPEKKSSKVDNHRRKESCIVDQINRLDLKTREEDDSLCSSTS